MYMQHKMYSQKLFKRQKLRHETYHLTQNMLQIITDNIALKKKNTELERELYLLKKKNHKKHSDKSYLYIS